jgi:hypothetical protein
MHLIPLIQLLATIKDARGPDPSAVPQFLSRNRSLVIAEAVALVRGAVTSSRQGNEVHRQIARLLPELFFASFAGSSLIGL